MKDLHCETVYKCNLCGKIYYKEEYIPDLDELRFFTWHECENKDGHLGVGELIGYKRLLDGEVKK